MRKFPGMFASGGSEDFFPLFSLRLCASALRIPLAGRAGGAHIHPPLTVDAHGDRPVPIGSQDFDGARPQSMENAGRRHPPPAAGSRRDECHPWPNGFQKLGERRCPAPVMCDFEDIGAQAFGIGQHRALEGRFGIRGKQHRDPTEAQTQDERAVVRRSTISRASRKHSKLHSRQANHFTFPETPYRNPALARQGPNPPVGGAVPRGAAFPHLSDRQAFEDAREPSDVVVVAMGEDHRVQPPDAVLQKERNDHPTAGVHGRSTTTPSIDEQTALSEVA